MPVYHGVNISFGTAGTTATEFGTMKLQSTDHDYKSDVEMVKDGNGQDVAKIYFNQYENATFEYIPVVGGTGQSPTLPVIGDLFTVANTTNETNIAGTTWLVDEVSTKTSNTSAMKVTVKASKYPNITS